MACRDNGDASGTRGQPRGCPRSVWGLIVAATLCLAVIVGVALVPAAQPSAQAAPPSLAPVATPAVPPSRAAVQFSFAPVVRAVAPAVVNIYAKKVVRVRNPLMEDPFFRRFFGDQGFGVPQERVQNSLGSGVVVGADGLIVTNNHVIAETDAITVALSDGREFEAELLTADPRTDLAVLKINPGRERLPVLDFADSDAVEVGDLVLAVGNPFGVGQTVTMGIVSAVARTQVGVADYRFFIQTDASINPGNSGGALVDATGRLVGINSSIYSRDGGSLGIGFAIPSAMVRSVVNAARAGGVIVRPWLGARGQTVTPDIASSLGLDRPAGVLINKLMAGGPAARAGLAVGDVITAIDGKGVADSEALAFRLATKEPGGAVELTAWKGGRQRIVSLPLEGPPEKPAADRRTITGTSPLAGATVANLSPALAETVGRDFDDRGVVVLSVTADSAAESVGFKPGDKIIEINDQAIGSSKDLVDALAGTRNRRWHMSIERDGRVIETTLRG